MTDTIRVLIVEDFAAFRSLLASTLKQRTGLIVVGESSNGLEAIKQAQTLRPDLILLDIGLPKLNGIEVIRRTRSFLDHSKVLIVSQENSEDVVQEAFAAGADGYLAKADAGTHLLPAIDAVLSGERFIGRVLTEVRNQ